MTITPRSKTSAAAYLIGVLLCQVIGGCGRPSDAANLRAVDNCSQLAARVGGRLEMTLDLSGSKVTDDDLATLELPKELTSLDLAYTGITDKGLENLKRAPKLESLRLTGTKVTDRGLQQLKGLENLWEVGLGHTSVSADGQRSFLQFLAPRTQAHLDKVSQQRKP